MKVGKGTPAIWVGDENKIPAGWEKVGGMDLEQQMLNEVAQDFERTKLYAWLANAHINLRKWLGKHGFEFCTGCGGKTLMRTVTGVKEYADGHYGKTYDFEWECLSCGKVK